MKTNKDLNWKKFYLRLTVILLNPIAFFIGATTIDTYNDLEYIVVGLVCAISVWVIYFAVCWLVKGLHS